MKWYYRANWYTGNNKYMSERLVVIKSFSHKAEAEVTREVLLQNNIWADVYIDDAGGMRPDLGWGTGGAKIKVQENDAERASEIIKAYFSE